MARLLLTGASGFVGGHVLATAIEAGHQVAVLTQSKEWRPKSNEVLVLRACASDAVLTSDLQNFAPDAAILLAWAGIPDYSARWSMVSLESNLRSMRLALEAGVGRLVSSGSCWEYAAPSGPIAEDAPTRADAPFQFAKRTLLRLLSGVCDESAVGWRWVRLFYVYGPGQRNEALVPTCLNAWRSGYPPSLKDEDAAVDLIHVQDVASALLLMATVDGPSGVFNVGSGAATRVGDVSRAVRALIDGRTWHPPISSGGFWADNSLIGSAYGWSPRITLAHGLTDWVNLRAAENASAS